MRYLIVVVALIVVACNTQKSKKESMPPLRVEVATVITDSLTDKIDFSSSVEPLYSSLIEPRVSGYLTNVAYNNGGMVKSGQLLFTIDDTEYQTALYAAEANLRSAQTEEVLAKSNYERAIPLAKIDAISQMQLDEYKSSYDAAIAAVKYAEEQLKINRLNVGYTNIYATIDGILAATPAQQGDYVGVGTSFATLTTIEYLDTVNISLSIPTSRYIEYKGIDSNSYDNKDLLSNIVITLADGSTYPFKGTYDYTAQGVAGGSSSVTVVIRVVNPKRFLKSGMFTRVSADIGEKKLRLLIPQKGVSQMQGVNSVWVVNPDSTLTERRVTLGATYGDMWEIKSGVSSGEMVLLTGQLKIREGEKVIPIKVK